MSDTKHPAAPILHQPFNAPRSGHIGEHIYTAKWQEIADRPADPFDCEQTNFTWMFRHYRWNPGQREATIAASIICWLATNCGRGFVWEAERLAEKLAPNVSRETAWLMQWASENARRMSINRGVRLLEALLSQPRDDDLDRFPDWPRIEEPSGKDYEAAECVVSWLGAKEGQKLIADCQAMTRHKHDEGRLASLENQGFGNSIAATRLREQLGASAA